MKNRRKTYLAALAMCTLPFGLMAQEPAYKNQSLSHGERTKDLISRMTLDEKINQMVNAANGIPHLDVPKYNWWNECLHGLARAGRATLFPQSIALGATFDPVLVEEIASAISDEARAFHSAAIERNHRRIYTGLTFYTPNVNIFRDPRWGRGQETYGEDPFLTSRIGVAFVEGLQGNDPHYLKTAACAKHFAVHSGPEELRHEFDAESSPRDMYETYLPAFKALVQEADVASVMGAYNRVNGEAACASEFLLQKLLRDDWGFDGYVTSDCGALVDIFAYHKLVKTPEEAAALAANNGLNLNCGSVYSDHLAKAVEMGLVSEETIDDLLYDLMITRFKLGMFDDPEKVKYNSVDRNIVDSKHHQDLAYDAALKSIVLLENKNNTLPLKGDENFIFVTGPNANNPDALIGNYYGASGRMTTFFEGMALGVDPGVTVEYRQGVLIDKPNSNPMDWTTGEASHADAVVVCLGLTSLLEGEEGESIASSQKGDMVNNSLPQSQIDFLRKINQKAGGKKPIIVVITGGCPVELGEIKELADAVLYAWYPGEAGGKAVADLILGKASPSGRTPLTFVKDVNRLPAFEDYSMEGRTYKYMTDTDNILYPFGYGLSYSTFDYEDMDVPEKVKAGDPVKVSVKVTNDGQMNAEEVVQVYVTDEEASVPVPVRQLAGIKRVALAPGESQIVELEIAPTQFSLITDDVERKIEPGYFTVSIGGGQPVSQTPSYLTSRVQVKGKKQLEL